MKLNHEVMRYLRLDELRSHCPMNYVLLLKQSSYPSMRPCELPPRFMLRLRSKLLDLGSYPSFH